MPRRPLRERNITVSEVKKTLESIGEEHLDQFQRRSLDYAAKFSKVDAATAERLLAKLKAQFKLEEVEAVQIINCMPESLEEIRMFLAGGRRIVEASKVKGILNLLDEHRKKE